MSEHIEGAVLYLDSGCTESFQFVGAFPILLDLGVRAICSLENMCSLDVVSMWWFCVAKIHLMLPVPYYVEVVEV